MFLPAECEIIDPDHKGRTCVVISTVSGEFGVSHGCPVLHTEFIGVMKDDGTVASFQLDDLKVTKFLTLEELAKFIPGTAPQGQQIAEKGESTDEEKMRAMAEELGLEYVDLRSYSIDHATVSLVPFRFVQSLAVIPIHKSGRLLKIATSEPYDVFPPDFVRLVTGCEVEIVLSTKEQIGEAIRKYHG